MKRPLILALVASATLLCAGAASAGNVQWSLGINLPPVATVVSNGPVYWPAQPAVYAAPVVYAPRAYYDEPAVVFEPPRVVYRAPLAVVREGRGWQRPVVVDHRDWRGVPEREGRWVPLGHRDERRRHHDERADYRY
ncbi:MAG: hypothetical protein ABIV63_02730 [Caldimonas sp.]